jgi:hypothetical protein
MDQLHERQDGWVEQADGTQRAGVFARIVPRDHD